MAEATEQLRIIINAQDNASAVVKNVGNTIQSSLGNAISGAAAGVGFAAFNQAAQALGQAFDFAKNSIVGFNATLEQSRIAWSTMLGGGEAAESMLKRIQTFAASTPFSFPQVEQAARRFVAMGIAAGDVIPLMRSVGAAAIAVGGGADAVNRISLALGQMSTRTKVTAEDMMQLTEVGIPAWRILAEATGQSVAQIQDSVTKGKVSADVMIAAFQNFSEVNWAKLLDTQTFNTAISNIQDNVTQLIATAFKPLFDSLRDLAIRFEAFTKSADMQAFATSVRNAQVAVGVFLDTAANSGPVLMVFESAVAGVATVLGVQLVAAAIRATIALAPLVAAFVAANAPLIALGVVAAATALVIAANWDQIVEATQGLVSGITELVGNLVTWIGGTAMPALIEEWSSGWENLFRVSLEALNSVGRAWEAFWGQSITGGATGFDALQTMATGFWKGFSDLAVGGLRAVLTGWNTFIQAITALHDAGLGNALPAGLDNLAGKFVDVDAVANNFGKTLEGLPEGIGQKFSQVGVFFHDILPAAIKRAVELVQAAGGDLANLPALIQAELERRAKDLADAGKDAGKQTGKGFGEGVVEAAKPLIESLARMLAQLAAGPATAALEDTQKAIERSRLVLADITQSPEARQAAMRNIVDTTLNVLPGQQLAAFDATEVVRRATQAEQTATLLQQIQEAQRARVGQTAVATGSATATGTAPTGTTAGPTLVQPPGSAPPRTMIDLRIEVSTDGSAPQIFDQLLEANGQAQMPPVIQVSAVRRN